MLLSHVRCRRFSCQLLSQSVLLPFTTKFLERIIYIFTISTYFFHPVLKQPFISPIPLKLLLWNASDLHVPNPMASLQSSLNLIYQQHLTQLDTSVLKTFSLCSLGPHSLFLSLVPPHRLDWSFSHPLTIGGWSLQGSGMDCCCSPPTNSLSSWPHPVSSFNFPRAFHSWIYSCHPNLSSELWAIIPNSLWASLLVVYLRLKISKTKLWVPYLQSCFSTCLPLSCKQQLRSSSFPGPRPWLICASLIPNSHSTHQEILPAISSKYLESGTSLVHPLSSLG